MKNLIIITYLCCTCLSSVAQTCVQDYLFSTQLELDAFVIDNPDCTAIDGSVILLGDANGSNIVDLSPLSQITLITGDLEIKLCNQLISIESLNSTLTVEGNTTISDNFNLQEILLDIKASVLSNIEISRNNNLNYIFGGNQIDSLNNMAIIDNQNLSLIEGFEGLEYIQEELFFLDNISLLNIPSFNTARYIHNVRLIGNSSLVEIDGFNQLDSVFNVVILSPGLNRFKGFNNTPVAGGIVLLGIAIEEIDIFRNLETAGAIGISGIVQEEPITLFNKLISITLNLNIYEINGGPFNSFLKLKSVGFNRIEVFRCNFEHLDFLSNVKSVTGFKPYFRIQSNPNLSDISGLDGIEADSIHWFNVTQNPNLSICHSKLVCAVLERGDNDPPSVWEDNGSGCNSTEEILAQCADKPDEPEVDPTLCPIASRPGMQINRIDKNTYDIMYNYGVKRMYLTEIAYTELLDLIEFHKVEKDIRFDFNNFTLERYCNQAEVISRGATYDANLPEDPIMQDIIDRVMSEVDFFSNFVLTIREGECVKL